MGNIEGRFGFCYVLMGQAVVCNIAESDAKPQARLTGGFFLAHCNLYVMSILGFVARVVGGDDSQDVIAFRQL